MRITRYVLVFCLLAAAAAAVAAPPKLPYGPDGPGRFGAYYSTLKYSPEWDAQWRVGEKADVVVRFDQFDYRLVFWRGTNFMPFWVNDKRTWYGDGSVVRPGGSVTNDHICKYSFASVIESSDARVVVRWRYAPLDAEGKLTNTDEMTGWNDWVDEYYTIYPDGFGVRTIKLFSSDPKINTICQTSTIISSGGQAVSAKAVAKASNVQLVQLPGAMPFQVVPAGGTAAPLQTAGRAPGGGWPVYGATDPSADALPGVRALSHLNWKPYAQDRTSKSWMMLVGLTDGKSIDPQMASASWLSAPTLAAVGCSSSGYSPADRAYQLSCSKPQRIKLKLQATAKSPALNPAFVINGWGRTGAALAVDGKPVQRGSGFRCGFRKTVNGSDLVLWVRLVAKKPVTLEIKPVEGGK